MIEIIVTDEDHYHFYKDLGYMKEQVIAHLMGWA